MQSLKAIFQIKYWVVLLAGALCALCTWKLMTLEGRYATAITGAVVVLSLGMMAINRIEDFLIYILIFNVPFSLFAKFLFYQKVITAAPGISLGLAEMLIPVAYIVWFAQVFIARSRPLPQLQNIDWLIMLFMVIQCLSWLGAKSKTLGAFDIIYNTKHIFMYFFIAHKLKRHHLKWIVVIILFAILVEGSISVFERFTGYVGIGRAKGNVEASHFGVQLEIAGIEDEIRASGTTSDSHTLGLYLAMVLPVPFVFMAKDFLKPSLRFALGCVFLIGIIALVLSFARSGWFSFAISIGFTIMFMTFSWRSRTPFVLAGILALAAICLYPNTIKLVHKKLFGTPWETITSRFKMNRTAVSMWGNYFIFGCGPGNYMVTLDEADIIIYGRDDIPVHNSYLYVAAETGLFGLIAFYGVIFAAMWRCWKMLKCKDLLIRLLALSALTGLFAYLLDGLVNLMFKTPVPYAQLWVYIGISAAFSRLLTEQTPNSAVRL